MVANEMFEEIKMVKGKFIPLLFEVPVLDYEEEYVFFPLITFVTNETPVKSNTIFKNSGTLGISSCPKELDDYSFMN